ncbi:MAG: hypothetical protein GY701_31920 [Sulfitobacter sp.]|nr:hypothetical protein [Sulfitobacter sp.]
MADSTHTNNPDGGGPRDAGGSLPGGVSEMPDADQPTNQAVQSCPQSNQLKSIHIDIGWTFTAGAPAGEYTLVLAGQTFTGTLSSGQIRINNRLNSICGGGSLEIRLTNGPIFRSDVILDLPAIQTAEGLKRRLTNLGYYGGTDGPFDNRARWAIRTFKHVVRNQWNRHDNETENDIATQTLQNAVQTAYGSHPGDSVTGPLTQPGVSRDHPPCHLFGQRALRRTSFTPYTAGDDRDAEGNGDNGTWEHASAAGESDAIAGTFTLYLRAFDPAAGDPVIPNRVNLPQHLRMMQLVLFELGFWVIRGTGGWATESGTETRLEYHPDGRFGKHSEWAVREFQCYARMANAAEEDTSSSDKRYLPRLLVNSPTPLAGRAQLAGAVTGAIDEGTRNALQAWADRLLRCPVVIYASTDNQATAPAANGANFVQLVKENLWRHDDHGSSNPRMYAIDWSGYYAIPAAQGGTISANGATFPRPIVIGDWQSYMRWQGPRSIPPRHTWNQGELLPDALTGSAWATMGAAARSSFRVVRAVSEVECLGFFDSVNSYDNAFVSVGPCHWTLGIANSGGSGAVQNGELCGYLSYLREADAGAFRDAVGFFGVRSNQAWSGNGSALFSSSSRKYAAWTEQQVQTGTTAGGLSTPWRTMTQAAPQAEPEGDYLKNWHWFYRYVMAGRVNVGYRQRMWHMARVRLRDILAVPWGTGVANVGTTPATIGDVFTSERVTAMILRLHIRGPAWVVNSGHAGARLTGALTRAQAAQPSLTWTGDPSAWTNAYETALINGLTAELAAHASAGVQQTVNYVRNWAGSWGTNPRGYALNLATIGNTLDTGRNSFTLDTSNLPPAPP